MTYRFATRLPWLVGWVVLAGCAGGAPPEPPEPTAVPVDVTASPGLNPHADGDAQSVDLLILHLESPNTFQALDLPALYPQVDKPRQSLGPDLVDSQLVRLSPGDARQLELRIDSRARYVGVVAAFEQYHRAVWRGVVQLRDESALDKVLFRDKRLKIVLDDLAVSVTLGR